MAKINTVGMCTIAIHTHMYMHANTHMYTALHTHLQYPPQTCKLTRPTPHKAELTLSGKSTYLSTYLSHVTDTPQGGGVIGQRVLVCVCVCVHACVRACVVAEWACALSLQDDKSSDMTRELQGLSDCGLSVHNSNSPFLLPSSC